MVAVDGSGHEYQEAFDRYPSTRVLYLQIAGVFIDLQKMLDHTGPFVNPSQIAAAMGASVVSGFLPGSYLEHDRFKDPVVAFRAETYNLFAETRVHHRTLVDLLGEVQKYGVARDAEAAHKGQVLLPKCPNEECDLSNSAEARRVDLRVPLKEPGWCPACGGQLWATDMLRVYEDFRPDAANSEVMGRVRDTIEHLVLIGVALSFEASYPKLLEQTAFLYDAEPVKSTETA